MQNYCNGFFKFKYFRVYLQEILHQCVGKLSVNVLARPERKKLIFNQFFLLIQGIKQHIN
jgi:hypothetical protein